MALVRAFGNVGQMEDEFKRLGRRVVSLWRWHGVITLLALAIAALGGSTIGVITGASGFIFLPISIVLLILALTMIFWYPGALFRRWRYRVTPKTVELHKGVVFQREVHVPMHRVQHVDLERGPLERRLGLTRLILFTAGTKSARQEIPGLDHDGAEALRNEIAKYLNDSRREP